MDEAREGPAAATAAAAASGSQTNHMLLSAVNTEQDFMVNQWEPLTNGNVYQHTGSIIAVFRAVGWRKHCFDAEIS